MRSPASGRPRAFTSGACWAGATSSTSCATGTRRPQRTVPSRGSVSSERSSPSPLFPLAVREVRRGRVARSAIALAAAPLVAIGLFSLVVTYQRYEGRYFIAAFALCAATFGGYALARRWLGTAVVGIAVVTALLTLVNAMGKPTGITILGENASDRVWSMPRWQQQGILRPTPSERDEVATMRFVEEHVPSDARLGDRARREQLRASRTSDAISSAELTIVDVGDVALKGHRMDRRSTRPNTRRLPRHRGAESDAEAMAGASGAGSRPTPARRLGDSLRASAHRAGAPGAARRHASRARPLRPRSSGRTRSRGAGW